MVSGVNRACSVFLSARVIDTTTFICGSDAYLPIPASRLSPAGTSGTVIFAFSARMVAVPLAPAAATARAGDGKD